jgi:hypothetical protein
VTETIHKVPLVALLNNRVFKPCACGIQYKQDKKGNWKCYLYQGEPFRFAPAPVLEDFIANIYAAHNKEDEEEKRRKAKALRAKKK